MLLPALVLLMNTLAPATGPTPELEKWQSLQYGMFIHFGMLTFTQNEYGQVPAEASAYAPTRLDPAQWVRVAKAAGMKYAVLTTKHCYGHCLWPTQCTDYSVVTSSVHTDVVGEFVHACHQEGIMPGFYYLLGWDAHHQPKMTPDHYEMFVKDQLRELLTEYGPIGEIWLDIPFDMGPNTPQVLQSIYDHVKSLQPRCLVLLNQGFHDGNGPRSDKATYFYQKAGDTSFPIWPTDLLDGEVTLPPPGGHDPWVTVAGTKYYCPMETCMTLAHHWFWVEGDSLKSVPHLAKIALALKARHANLLLDVAPDKTGRIPKGSVDRLMALKQAIAHPDSLPKSVIENPVVTASNVFHEEAQFEGKFAVDHDSETRWATDDDAKSAWLEVDLGSPKTFSAAYLCEGWNRVRRFSIEVEEGSGWRPVCKGTRIGDNGITVRFAATTARRVRLSIESATVGPTIWDFDLLAP